MKFNLKNRPVSWIDNEDSATRKWFEGFEKELREIIDGCHALSAGTKLYLKKEILDE